MFSTQQNYSGSFNFAPSLGEIILTAFDRIQVRPTEIQAPHLQRAVMEFNLLQSRMSNMQPNLFTVDLQSLPLASGQATYSLPADTVMLTNVYMRTDGDTTSDRVLFQISQTEYASIPNKTTEAPPNQYWYNRVISQTITLYPTPDSAANYTVYYYRVRQQQDALPQNGYNPEVPYRFLDYVTAELSYRLARIYRPDLEQARKADAMESWQIVASQDVENVPLAFIPGTNSYWSN